jgi:predicted anti-sigma-YlaC factor YlaD
MFGLNKKTECDRVSDKLSAYIDGQLTDKELTYVELHLDECKACAAELAGLRATVELLGSVEDVPAPRSFAIDPATASVPERPHAYGSRALRWMRPALAISAALFLVMLFVDLGTTFTRQANDAETGGALDSAEVLGSAGGVDWGLVLRIVEWGWGAVVIAFAIAYIYVSWRRHRGYPDSGNSNDLLR